MHPHMHDTSWSPQRDSHIAEGVLEIADGLSRARPRRPVLVVVAVSGGQAGVDPELVLDKVRQSGATMYAATVSGSESPGELGGLADASGREQVLGDGPKQSGGRRVDVRATSAFPQAFQQIGDDMLAQYAITYELPAGAMPDKRINVSLKKRGVTLRAPSLVPDR